MGEDSQTAPVQTATTVETATTVQKSTSDVGVQVLLPFQPAPFTLQTENQLVRQAVTLAGRWSSQPFAHDSVEQRRLWQEFIEAWRGVGGTVIHPQRALH